MLPPETVADTASLCTCQPVFVMASMLPPETVADTASLCTCQPVFVMASMLPPETVADTASLCTCQPVFVMASMLPPETVADTASLCTCQPVFVMASMLPPETVADTASLCTCQPVFVMASMLPPETVADTASLCTCQPVFVMASMLPPETVADTASLCTCQPVFVMASMLPPETVADTASLCTCQPVFVMASMLPPETVADTASLCTACEAVGGRGSMKGAQRIRGQWRLYPNTRAARDKLLLEGFTLRGTKIQPLDKNPFLLHPGGEEIPSTGLWIGNVSVSCDDGEIAKALTKLGCELRSAMKAELARYADRKLTNWVTGRHFVEITVPKEPLPTRTQVGIFSATLYHKEQREKRLEERTCRNCLEKGHGARLYELPGERAPGRYLHEPRGMPGMQEDWTQAGRPRLHCRDPDSTSGSATAAAERELRRESV